jgi:hypothetical protein
LVTILASYLGSEQEHSLVEPTDNRDLNSLLSSLAVGSISCECHLTVFGGRLLHGDISSSIIITVIIGYELLLASGSLHGRVIMRCAHARYRDSELHARVLPTACTPVIEYHAEVASRIAHTAIEVVLLVCGW